MEEDYVELEMDSLNQHECMATMIAVIKHMQRNKITPEVAPVSTINQATCCIKKHCSIGVFIAVPHQVTKNITKK